jgi:regulator of replication initiation timing
MSQDPTTWAMVASTIVAALLFGLRLAIKTFFKDKIDFNAAGATNEVISNLRNEVARLATTVSEMSHANKTMREERDGLRTEVMHLTYAVNALRNVLVELLGEEEALRRLRERGIVSESKESR